MVAETAAEAVTAGPPFAVTLSSSGGGRLADSRRRLFARSAPRGHEGDADSMVSLGVALGNPFENAGVMSQSVSSTSSGQDVDSLPSPPDLLVSVSEDCIVSSAACWWNCLRRSNSVSHHSPDGNSGVPSSLVGAGVGAPLCEVLSARSIQRNSPWRTVAVSGCGFKTSAVTRSHTGTRRASSRTLRKRASTFLQGSAKGRERWYPQSQVTSTARAKQASTLRPANAHARATCSKRSRGG